MRRVTRYRCHQLHNSTLLVDTGRWRESRENNSIQKRRSILWLSMRQELSQRGNSAFPYGRTRVSEQGCQSWYGLWLNVREVCWETGYQDRQNGKRLNESLWRGIGLRASFK